MQRRKDIEGLRAVAVALVLLYHAKVPRITGGYIGVDVFFVLSGFLITSLLVNEHSATGRISFGGFYARRVRRLLPMAAVVAVATLVASWHWLEPLRLRGLANDMLGVASFSSNFVFAHRGADYLQSTLPPSPLQHYWSLAVEEQFYLVWPALIALVTWRTARGALSSIRMRIGVLSGAIAVASFVICMMLMNTAQPWAFFTPHARAFELAIGALVAVVPMGISEPRARVEAVFAWVGLIVIVVVGFWFTDTTLFPGPWALVPVLATALVLRGGSATSWSPVALLSLQPFQWLGARSYSAYLWHWPMLIIGAAALKKTLTVPEALVLLGMSLAASELSYQFIENPVRHNRALIGVRAFALGTVLILVVGVAGAYAYNNPPALSSGADVTTPTLSLSTDTTIGGTAVATTVPGVPALPVPGLPAIQPVVDGLTTQQVPGNISPSLSGAVLDQPTIYSNGCHAGFSATQVKDCVFGDPASTTVVGLYGDSHAAEWFPAFEKVAIKRHWRFITYTKRGCPPADMQVFNKVVGKVYKECNAWRANALKKMAADGVKVVFVGVFERELDAVSKIPIWQKDWRTGMQASLDGLKAAGMTPILIEDSPFPGQDIPTCLSAESTNVPICNPNPGAAFRSDLADVRHDFEASGTLVLHTHQWFCTTTACPTIVGNLLVYRDDNHMTVSYSMFLAPLLDAAVADVVAYYAQPH
jgi:peptidoglycan/LPS O-acetylase OafA/YrhL